MDAPCVLLIGPAGDAHIARLQQVLEATGARVRLVDSRARPAGPRVVFSPTDEVNALGDVPLADVTGVFVRAIPPRHPAFSSGGIGPSGGRGEARGGVEAPPGGGGGARGGGEAPGGGGQAPGGGGEARGGAEAPPGGGGEAPGGGGQTPGGGGQAPGGGGQAPGVEAAPGGGGDFATAAAQSRRSPLVDARAEGGSASDSGDDFATATAQSRFSLEDVRVAEAEGGALRDAMCAALELLWSRGIPVLNPPVAGTYEQQKPFQLSVARRAGFLLPRTLITNDPREAARFVEELYAQGRECVAKPVRGGAHATLVAPGDERIPRLGRAPVTLQERAPGADVRVLLLDNKVVAAARLEGTDAVDYRTDPRYQRGEARYVDIDVDVEVRRGLVSVQMGLGIPFGGADLRFDEQKGWTFLEMNAAPAFLELEERTGRPVTAALVERLLREGD